MIKIIKEGIRKITTCDKCGCEFSYEHEDIEVIDISDMFGNLTITKKIECPQCKHYIILSKRR